jgi:photosynthetic reaction center cytochrome c subunit
MDNNRQKLRDEVTGLLLKGGLIGAVTFGAAIAFMAVPRQIGKIWPTESAQAGFRGTGMDVIQFEADIAASVDRNALPETAEGPIPPTGDEQLAADVYPAAGPLGHLTVANYDRLVAAMRQWVGNDTLFESADDYATQVAYRMVEMTWAINQEWDAHVTPAGVTCYTCHRGNQVPQNVWFLPEPNSRWAGPSAMFQNQAMAANYSTALPIDAMKTYLLESDQVVQVNGLDSRNTTGEPGASIYHTYQTYSLMQHFANSMGANCTYCHNTRSIADPAGFTPAWGVAQIGRQMTIDINNVHILPTEPLLPPERLGPLGDVAKVNCATCHLQAPKTFNGASPLADWPELASSEPVYE